MDDLNILLNLTDDNWKQLEENKAVFKPMTVKHIVEALKSYSNIVNFITNGYLYGFTIECPNCKVEYDVTLKELSDKDIICQDCGCEYNQRRYITDLICGD